MSKRGMKPQQAAKLRAKQGLKTTKLQKLRVAKGLSQSELSAITGVAVRRIQHYEQQVSPIEGARLDTLCALCVALDCTLDDVLENKDIIAKLRMINKP